jgi:hypothetical protein
MLCLVAVVSMTHPLARTAAARKITSGYLEDYR